MNVLEELQQLNTEDPGNWPPIFKVGALAILLISIVIAGYFFDWKDQLAILDRAQAEEEELKITYTVKKSVAINLEVLRNQSLEIEQLLSDLLRQLPDKSEMEELLVDINQAGLGRGLQFELFKPAANETFIQDVYAELPITVRVTGSYHDISAFASDISQLSRIVTLNDINLVSDDDSLILDATAKTFRFIDEEETINNEQIP